MSALSVIVIGGGIAGLTAAIALRRAGHRVTVSQSHQTREDCHSDTRHTQVYEKYGFDGELGAAVGLGPNTMEYLHSLGFDNTRAQACDGECIQRSSMPWPASICPIPALSPSR